MKNTQEEFSFPLKVAKYIFSLEDFKTSSYSFIYQLSEFLIFDLKIYIDSKKCQLFFIFSLEKINYCLYFLDSESYRVNNMIIMERIDNSELQNLTYFSTINSK